jgi:hypothetical protein
MPASFLVLKRAMGVAEATGPGPSWGEVLGELWPIISSPLSADGERLLLEVINHHGQLRLTETGELPHSLPPDEMLKSLAVQALGRWTRLTYLTELQRLELTASSSALQSMVRAVIQTALATGSAEKEADAITEEESAVDEAEEGVMWPVSPYPLPCPRPKPSAQPRRFAARPVGRLGNMTIINGERPKKSRRNQEYEYVG